MAIRTTTHVLKNSDIVNRPLPSTLLKGEPIVNTADGIVFFSGVTTSTNNWTPAGTGTTANFFEVGSNLYDLKIRNQIKSYSGVTNLSGKFLSGTTSGFVLADISNIVGVDTYPTGFTYSNNVITISQNNSGPTLSVLINTMTGLTINGTLSATTANFDSENVTTLNATGATITTLNATTENVTTLNATGATITTLNATTENVTTLNATGATITTLNATTENVTTLNATGATITTLNSTTVNVTGTETVNNLTITGTGLYNTTATGSNANEIVNFGSLTAYTAANDIYVSGGTYNAGTLTLNRHNASAVTITGFTTTDTYVTGYTYNPATNTFTIKQNQGQADLTAQFNTVSGLTVSNLTAGRVVYVGTSGLLTNEAGFEYNDVTNTLAVSNIAAAGDVVVQGNLTVFGTSVSAFTSQLYVEDPNVIFNYNPTGSTTVTSVNAGLTIQDGSGISGSSVELDIVRMQNLTGLTASNIPNVSEYTATTGYANRGWITQLNDIVIRSTDIIDDGTAGSINGVRVLAEFDILDGGSY